MTSLLSFVRPALAFSAVTAVTVTCAAWSHTSGVTLGAGVTLGSELFDFDSSWTGTLFGYTLG